MNDQENRTEMLSAINDFICRECKVLDADRVSKNELKRRFFDAAVKAHRNLAMARKLTVELFCANPQHPTFTGWPKEELAELRRERIKRISRDKESAAVTGVECP